MGYCYHNKTKDIQVYTKMNNNIVPEVPEQKKKMKQDYESVKNQVLESNIPKYANGAKTVDINQSNKTKKYTIN